MKTYFLPENLRPELRKKWGKAILGRKNEVKRRFKNFLERKGVKKVTTVGDFCSLNLPSQVKIFDGRIKRKKIKKILNFSISFKNPAGTIQKIAWKKIKLAINKNQNVFVDGEEDLLVIPAVLLSSENSLVVYGLPKEGICVIEVKKRVKRKIKRLLKRFRLRNFL